MKKLWEAELIISGGFLVTLISISDELLALNQSLAFNYIGFLNTLAISGMFLNFGLVLLILGFSCHLLFRLTWLAYSGVYSIEKQSDLADAHNSSSKNWVEKMNQLSELTFSISALLLFLMVSLAIWLTILMTIGTILPQNSWQFVLWITYLMLSIPYLLNFITFQRFSRTKFYRFYGPINKFYSVLTLSILYRPLAKNLMEKASWKAGLFLSFSLATAIIFASNTWGVQSIFNKMNIVQKSSFATSSIGDVYSESDEFSRLSIQNYVITDRFLDIRLTHPAPNDINIARKSGLNLGQLDSLTQYERMKLIPRFYKVYLDNRHVPAEFTLMSSGKYTVFRTAIVLDSLTSGIHSFHVTQPKPLRRMDIRTYPDKKHKGEHVFGKITFQYYPK